MKSESRGSVKMRCRVGRSRSNGATGGRLNWGFGPKEQLPRVEQQTPAADRSSGEVEWALDDVRLEQKDGQPCLDILVVSTE